MATVRTHRNKVKSYVTLLLLILHFQMSFVKNCQFTQSQQGSENHEKLLFRVNGVDDTLQFKDPLKRTIATRIRRSLGSASGQPNASKVNTNSEII